MQCLLEGIDRTGNLTQSVDRGGLFFRLPAPRSVVRASQMAWGYVVGLPIGPSNLHEAE
jgi:phage head maturation protease